VEAVFEEVAAGIVGAVEVFAAAVAAVATVAVAVDLLHEGVVVAAVAVVEVRKHLILSGALAFSLPHLEILFQSNLNLL